MKIYRKDGSLIGEFDFPNLQGANLQGADLQYANLQEADLRYSNLQGANLRRVNLQYADLRRADLQGANLQYADLRRADLQGADLQYADLQGANLQRANLWYADLQYANLQYADLQYADLRRADLQGADLQYADLQGANLQYADLQGANLSQCLGLLSPIQFVKQLEQTKEGIIAYKRIGSAFFSSPNNWKISLGSEITEVVNFDRTLLCACGVNIGTLEWCKENYIGADLWKCLIKWIDLSGICVPYNTDGKFRAEKITFLEKVEV